jgi:GNAT superfamily N-acetyltransferase
MDEKPHIAKLTPSHIPTGFDCGNEALNTFIRLHALPSQRANLSQTYVAVVETAIIGYHTLVVGSVVYEAAPERLAKGVPRHPIPILLLARLAVDTRWHGRGLGAALVADAMRRTVQVAEIAGVRALLVHAKDSAARGFYAHLGFESFPGDPLVLYRMMKDIRSMRGNP